MRFQHPVYWKQLETLIDVERQTDKGLISRGQEINSKRVEFGSRPGLPSCWVRED